MSDTNLGLRGVLTLLSKIQMPGDAVLRSGSQAYADRMRHVINASYPGKMVIAPHGPKGVMCDTTPVISAYMIAYGHCKKIMHAHEPRPDSIRAAVKALIMLNQANTADLHERTVSKVCGLSPTIHMDPRWIE